MLLWVVYQMLRKVGFQPSQVWSNSAIESRYAFAGYHRCLPSRWIFPSVYGGVGIANQFTSTYEAPDSNLPQATIPLTRVSYPFFISVLWRDCGISHLPFRNVISPQNENSDKTTNHEQCTRQSTEEVVKKKFMNTSPTRHPI